MRVLLNLFVKIAHLILLKQAFFILEKLFFFIYMFQPFFKYEQLAN